MIVIKKYAKKFENYLVNLIELQLLLTNVVLPFTIYWGMAISPVSMISTLVGTPIVFLIIMLTGINYLIISFGAKIKFLVAILEIACKAWQKFITVNLNIPLIIIPNLSTELLIIATIIYVLIYYKIKHKRPYTILFSISYFLLIYFASNLFYSKPDCVNAEKIILKYDKKSKKLTLIVDKIPKNYADWHFRTVLPTIRKNYGQSYVNCIHIKKINKNLQKYLDETRQENFYFEILIEQ
jgi:hypothetical protein